MKRSAAGLLALFALLAPGCNGDNEDDFLIIRTSAADLNLDGFADLVIGAPLDPGAGTATSKRGAVFVYLGSKNGPSATPDLTIFGTEDGAQFGSSLAFVGDVNGHGAPDLVVGAPLDDGDGNNSNSTDDRGRAYVFFGGPSMDDIPDVTMTGAEPGAHFGASVGRIADTNGDGFDDWIVGAPLDDGDGNGAENNTDRGRAYFFYGGFTPDNVADVTFTGTEDEAQFGAAVDSAGDFNGGGAEDIAIGAPLDDGDGNASDSGADRGRVFVFLGGNNLDATADLTLTGDEDDAHFGAALAPALDVNGDDIDDLLVGAPLHNAGGGGSNADRGRAYVFFGGTTPDATPDVTISGAENGGQLGAAVSRLGDLNGDNQRDFVVGAPLENPNSRADAGSAYVFFGGPSVDGTFDLELDGAEAGAHFGASVAGPGDFNKGGRDVVIGAPLDDADGNASEDGDDRGSAFLFSGGSGTLDANDDAIVDGAVDGAHAATAIAN